LFTDLQRCFPVTRALAKQANVAPPATLLNVYEVGSFEASFAPTQADFARLDPRFRLADALWRALPAYDDFGFAIFKLKPGAREMHPMAFTFPLRDPDRLFFPTVHIHHDTVESIADFEHVLYWQSDRPLRWRRRSTACVLPYPCSPASRPLSRVERMAPSVAYIVDHPAHAGRQRQRRAALSAAGDRRVSQRRCVVARYSATAQGVADRKTISFQEAGASWKMRRIRLTGYWRGGAALKIRLRISARSSSVAQRGCAKSSSTIVSNSVLSSRPS
jgi:hypothetical protein